MLLIMLFLFVPFYTTKLFISPVYFGSILSIFFAILYKNRIPKSDAIPICIMLLFSLYVMTRFDFFEYNQYGYVINLLVSFLYILSFSLIRNSYDKNYVVNTFIKTSWFVVFMVSIDTFFRFFFPPQLEAEVLRSLEAKDIGFYVYKSSWLFSDSNTVGLLCLSYICALAYLKRNYLIDIKFLVLSLSFLLVLSISRSAILSLAFLLFLYNGSKLIKIVTVPLGVTMLISFFFVYAQQDLSFFTKMRIFDQAIEFIGNEMTALDFIFGLGVDGSKIVFTKVAHSYFLTLFFDLGMIGVIFSIVWLFYLMYKDSNMIIYVAPMMLCGLSYFMYYGAPFYFLVSFFLVSTRAKVNSK